jgi:hypothetical protein
LVSKVLEVTDAEPRAQSARADLEIERHPPSFNFDDSYD